MTIARDEQFDPYSGPYGLEHDLPLTFHWRILSTAIAGLCLPRSRSPRHDDARNAVLAEAVLAEEGNRWISFSRRKAFYTGRRRYHGTAFTYHTVLAAVADGVAADLLVEDRALPGSRGRQSRLRATPLLAGRLKDIPAYFQPN